MPAQTPRRGVKSRLYSEGPCPPPEGRGAYILPLLLNVEAHLPILGGVRLEPGVYLYVGSALGPGGLRSRLSRHLEGSGRLWWHVDYLRRLSEPLGYTACLSTTRVEEDVALECSKHATPGPRGFGSSDSSVETHLYKAGVDWWRVAEDCLARVCGHSITCLLQASSREPRLARGGAP